MKKIIFGLIATVLLTSLSFGQTKTDFETLSIIKSEKIIFSNNIVKSFFEVTKFKSLYSDVTFDEANTELLTLKNSYQCVKFSIKSKLSNLIYAVYNKDKNDFIWYFVNNTNSKIEVLSPDNELLATFINSNGYVNLENIANKRSVFGACMDAVEEDYTNDFIGWASWNASPLPALTAAVTCQGCAKGWWKCPPAYLATLEK